MAQQQQKYTDANNAADRMELLYRGVRMRTLLGTFGPYSLGQIANIKLRNVGVITGLDVRVTGTVTCPGAAPTAGALAPYPVVSKFSLVDYNTTERVSAPGQMLYLTAGWRQHRPYMCTGQGSVDTQQTATPTSTGTLYANYYVPVARDPMRDLTGAILAQTVVGEMYLNVTFPGNLVGSDPASVYTAAGGGANGTAFYVTVWQNYIQPTSNRLPLIDLNTVYELLGNYTTSANIVSNGTVYLDYPNVRNVLGFYFYFIDNNALTVNGTDITKINLVANGNTQMREADPLLTRKNMRNRMGGDLPAGVYINDHDANPISTFIYSQVQAAITFGTVTASPVPYLSYMFESTYRQQTPLPGIAASS
jgi:hypothetical protein